VVAAPVGVDLLSTSPTLGSVRVVHQLDGFRDALVPHAAHGPVRDYLAHFDQARRTRALLPADILPPTEGSGRGDRRTDT
jgi:hypothetical protein